MKNTKLTRIFALALALLLCLSLLPMAAFAADEEAGGQEQVQEPQEQPQEQPQETQDDPPAEGAKDAPTDPPAEPAKTAVLAANTESYLTDPGETQPLDVHEHSFGEVIVDTEPTCTTDGTGHKECTDPDCDGREDNIPIPALGHDWANRDGYCERCSASHDHKWDENRVCTVCKYAWQLSEPVFEVAFAEYTKNIGMPQTSIVVSGTADGTFSLSTTEGQAGTALTADQCNLTGSTLTFKKSYENAMADGTYFIYFSFNDEFGSNHSVLAATVIISTPEQISLNISVTGPGRVLDADTNEAVSGAYSVNVGKQQAFLAVPNENCELSRLVINGVESDPDAVRSNGNLFSVIVRDESMDGVEITAEFKQQSCTVSFDANGGTGTMDAVTVNKGESVKLPKNAFTREDYGFKSWNSNPRGSGNITADEATVTPEGDLTLFAAWGKLGTIRIYRTADTSGENISTRPFLGEEYELRTYTFKDGDKAEFNTEPDGSGTTYKAGDKITLTEEAPTLTLYVPTIETVKVTVSFNELGTVSYDGKEVKSGDKVEVPKGKPAVFTFTPGENCLIKSGSVMQDGKEVGVKAEGYVFDADGTLSVTFIEKLRGTVTLGEKKILDQPVTATVKVENASNSERVLSYQWMRGSEKIEGATKGSYILTDEDAGKEIVCVVTSSTEAGELRSESFTPAARPAAPTSAQVAQHIVNGNKTALGGHPGRITGLNTTMQYSVNQTSWLNVAGTAFSYSTPRVFYFRYKATDTAPASEVAAVELKDYSTEVKPQASTEKNVYKYDVTLTETGAEGAKQVSTAPEDVGFLIPYPDGVKKDSHQLTLTHDPDGASVSFTQEDAGILAKSKNFSGYTLTAGDANPLSGTVTLDGDPYVGQTLKANTDKTNNTGTLSYQWTRDGKEIEGATADSYKLSPEDQGKKIACVVTSSVQTGSVTSEEVTVQEQKIEAVVDVLNDGDTSQGGHPGRIVGVNETMEYSTDGKTWKPVTSSPMLVNEGGTYTFRDKATQKTISSVEVKAYHGIIVRIKNPTYGKVKLYDGTEVSDGDMFIVEEGDTITFSFTPNSTRYAVSSLTLNGKQAANSANVVVGAGKKTLQLKNINGNAPYESRNLVVVTFASSSSSPRTGDSSNLGLWSALGVTSLAALAVIFVMTKKRRDSEA